MRRAFPETGETSIHLPVRQTSSPCCAAGRGGRSVDAGSIIGMVTVCNNCLVHESPGEETVDAITDALLTASRLLVAVSARSIAQVDETITFPQFRALVILATRGRVNVATLAAELEVQPSTATRTADRLAAAGLVDRHTSPASRRELVVELTERGRRVVDDVTGHRRRAIADIVAQMPVTHRRGLVRALTAFTAAGSEPDAVAVVPDRL
jgi:DNA-binding MarR family transcriptional regulator